MKTLIINSIRDKRDERIGKYIELIKEFSEYEIVYDEDADLKVDANTYDAILLTGSESRVSRGEYFDGMISFLQDVNKPVFGICYGHQLIARAHGGEVLSVGRFIKGSERIELLSRDSIFQGLPNYIEASESHQDEVVSIEGKFKVLARSKNCEVEAMKDRERFIYSTQFHPERSGAAGRKIIENFYSLIAEQYI